jgi:hypothetical protein
MRNLALIYILTRSRGQEHQQLRPLQPRKLLPQLLVALQKRDHPKVLLPLLTIQ